jgi:hypothetical protein
MMYMVVCFMLLRHAGYKAAIGPLSYLHEGSLVSFIMNSFIKLLFNNLPFFKLKLCCTLPC